MNACASSAIAFERGLRGVQARGHDALLSMMVCRRVCSWRSETVWPVLPPSARADVGMAAGRDLLLRIHQLRLQLRSATAAWPAAIALVEMKVVFMRLAPPRAARRTCCRCVADELAGGLVGALQLEQQRHLLVEVDAGGAGQRVGGARQQRGLVVRVVARGLARRLQPGDRRGGEAGQGSHSMPACAVGSKLRCSSSAIEQLAQPVGKARGTGRVVDVGRVAGEAAVAQARRIAALGRDRRWR